MTTLLERGHSPTLADFGGLSAVASAVDAVSASRFSAEFVEIALQEAGDEPAAQQFAARVISRVQNDFSLNSLVEVLQGNRLADDLEEGIFDHWLRLSQDGSVAVTVRTASLLGALMLKRNKARRALRLASAIASARLDDDPFYLAHAARIGGFLQSEEPHEGILEFLRDVVKVEEVADEANFELGLYTVSEALKEGDPARAKELMGCARVSFDSAAAAREARSDAKAFSIAISLLEGFYQRRPASEMGEWVTALKREAFAHSAYVYGSDDNPLLGSRGAQIAAWASLGMRLARLADEIDQAVWLDGIKIIEEELLTVYTASRTILGGQRAGGLEAIVSPRIQSSLLHNQAQALALRRWLSENATSDKAAGAAELIGLVDDYVAGKQPPNPLDATSGSPLLAALKARAKEFGAFDAASTAVARIHEIESSKISHAIMESLEILMVEFREVETFARYDEVRADFLALALKTLLFLEFRLDATAAQDPTGAYLFENPDGSMPLEKELQQDYLRFLRSSKLGTHDELRGVAAGRADVLHDLGRVRIITEIKRESVNCSFDALLESYGEQTTAYQNTNVPLGMLMALDLTRHQSVGQHISVLLRAAVGDFLDDGVRRGVLVVKVPGNRISPAVATERGRKRDRGSSPPAKKPAPRQLTRERSV
ncbi:hypothetical protein IVB02_19015 [Bradyrhizobium sp. 166]|uniref:hypothetical protein n=1 Tax=Bradyrhizobium sp. 166 TaxID=2782638 RepID=UPI001FF9E666|nr:hypothetical protein [Bradyrhizobium sp. 166]MCK1603475.1 hypothetical protein [Bradyrhizobium sp. 166]